MLQKVEATSSKADTLALLAGKLQYATVLPQYTFSYAQWQQNANAVISAVLQRFSQPLAVRSSAQNEDLLHSSTAGKYCSVLDVATTGASLADAIASVFASYNNPGSQDQVFVQPMLQQVECAGVAFSHDANIGGPYFVISADFTGSTDSVTSGAETTFQTWYIRHGSVPSAPWLNQLVLLFTELKQLFGEQPLDIEFAYCKQQLILLQLRPLLVNTLLQPDAAQYQLELDCIDKKLRRLTQRHPYLLGDNTCFGVMPDWNPAEIIGIKPKPLALSLYKELVTDSVWSTQRYNYGYRDVRDHALMLVMGGSPYIDIRVSFNSFVPAILDTSLAEKLVNYYMSKLRRLPQLHDKVEFNIVISCFSFDLTSRLLELAENGFSVEECQQIKLALTDLTRNIIADHNGVFAQDIASIKTLEQRQSQLIQSDLNKLDKIYWLLQDCKRYGTLPFAGLARAGFIAMQLLGSLRTTGLITEQNYQAFLHDVSTVSSALVKDKQLLPDTAFMKKYGHLRPGTYEITSPRYDEQPEKYFTGLINEESYTESKSAFALSLTQLNEINQTLQYAGLNIDAVTLFNFIKQAIEAREYSKFVFSRSLSDTLVLIERLGAQVGFDREQLAYADIKDILRLHSTSHSAAATLQSSINLGQDYHRLCLGIKLPALICQATEVQYFALFADEPNFITLKSVAGQCCDVKDSANLSGKIVFIEAADPGYDWLFSHNIAALVTQFGGCNSHMAIRAQELGIPAIIGAGELLFKRWKNAGWLNIDCACKKVDIRK